MLRKQFQDTHTKLQRHFTSTYPLDSYDHQSTKEKIAVAKI